MSDTFDFVEITKEQGETIAQIKAIATSLEDAITQNTSEKNGRLMAVAKTNLETAMMYAVKGLTRK